MPDPAVPPDADRDETARPTTEAWSQDGDARFRAFMDHNPAVAWAKDDEGRYVYLSRQFQERMAVRLADWAGKTDDDIWPPAVARPLRENDRSVLIGDRVVETTETVPGADGTESRWWVFKFPFADAAGRRYVGGTAVDITARERLEAELRRANDELTRRNADLEAALDKVRRLESIVTMCAWTRRMRLGDRWVSVEEYLQEMLGVEVSHGISDEAVRQMQADMGAAGEPPG